MSGWLRGVKVRLPRRLPVESPAAPSLASCPGSHSVVQDSVLTQPIKHPPSRSPSVCKLPADSSGPALMCSKVLQSLCSSSVSERKEALVLGRFGSLCESLSVLFQKSSVLQLCRCSVSGGRSLAWKPERHHFPSSARRGMEESFVAQKAAYFLVSLVHLSLNQISPAKFLP